MKNNQTAHRALISVAVAAMVYLFFHQVSIGLDSNRVSLEKPPIAYGYSSVAFSGTVYNDQGQTAVSTGSGVAIHINGSAQSTTTTNASGQYSFTGLTINQDDIITVFIDNEVEDGVLIAKLNDSELSDQTVTGMDIYADRLILRSDTSDRNITTTNLALADNVGDADVSAIYTVNGTSLEMKNGKELYIWEDTTHTTSGAILTHDLEVKGTLTMASSADITASGSLVITGDVTSTGDTTLTSYASGETLQLNGTSLNNLYIDFGIDAYFRMDEGTGLNASGATLNTGTGGSLFGPSWVQTNTGTTLFYNPYALEFDGSDDYVDFGDAFDINDSSTHRTFSTWFRRKSATSEDVIFAKKTASGSSTAGYMLWIDDADDKLRFEVANGTNDYLVISNSAITDQNWHHVAVSYNPLDTSAINLFLDGSIDVSSKSGSLESGGALSGTFSNAVSFLLGKTSGGDGLFHGTIDDFRVYKRALSGSTISLLGAGQKTTGSVTYYLKSNLDVDGDFCQYAGTVDVGTGYTINVAGDYCSYAGELKTNSGTVTLDGTTQAIYGSTAFNQLAKTNTTKVTLTFETNTQQTISGALTIQGALSKSMTVKASRTGSQAYLVLEDSGATLLQYLSVTDNNGSGGATLYCTEGCIDNDNNNNWEFLSECGDAVVSGSEECDDGNSNNNDSCPNDCRLAVCGDNVVEGEEQCEPPNAGTCLSNCLRRGSGGGGTTITNSSAASYFNRPEPPEGCGNGLFEPEKGEECDAGSRFNGLGTCSFDCKKLICGDGVVSPQIGEDCEPTIKGVRNGVTIYEVATCGETCTAPEVTAQGTVFGGCNRVLLKSCSAQSSSAAPQTPASRCGNGVVDAGEECDFGGICSGGSFDGSFWTDATSANTCITGGGQPTPSSGDGCSDQCKTEFCGDGFIQRRGADNQPGTADDEECDNGSVCSNDPNKSCRLNSDCGDGATCEYHAAQDATCSAQCKTAAKPAAREPDQQPAVCGNGSVEQGEECDDGNANGSAGSTCSEACIRKQVAETPVENAEPRCGDGIRQGDEECDQGQDNSDINENTCRTNCTMPTCGDFVVDAGEECDNGDGNSDFSPDSCRTSCRLPRCGDGVTDSGEECDGGLNCSPQCTLVKTGGRCGNAVVEEGEQCDDGNTVAGDGCSTFCQRELVNQVVSECGNGEVEPGEQCDDGNTINNDECTNECRIHEVVKPSAPEFVLDADVVVVNPDEYANGLKFLPEADPCSVLSVKGMNQDALSIRSAANRQNIPIVRNIALARALYANVSPGERVFGDLCTAVNALKPKESAPPQVVEQPLPQRPTVFNYGYYNYAQLQPMVMAQPPAGETGPGMVGVIIAGAASGIGWMRRKRR